MNQIPIEVTELLNDSAKSDGIPTLLEHLLAAIREIGSGLRDGIFSSENVGTQNSFGDHQLDVDIKTDEIIFNHLVASNLVFVASSEENPVEINCKGNKYSVAFDPLDGSSIIDANFAVGTIIGVWPGNGLVGRTGREMVMSIIAVYGPRVTLALALNSSIATGNSISLELTMKNDHWYISKSQFNIRVNAKTFAPGNLRATSDNEKYSSMIKYWIDSKYTLRYSGGLVPDVYHILIKGEGILSNVSSKSAKAKLRLLFEAAPIALVIEAAGGLTCVCPSEVEDNITPSSLLDVVISDLDKRVGVCYGSANDVEKFKSYLF